jgi:ABC-type sugar transport system permease subunit
MNGARARALTATVAATGVAVAVLAVARWGEERFARAGAVTIARSTAAYLAVVTPRARADSGDFNLSQLLVQARALTTLPGWTSPVEVYHETGPLVDATAPPLPAAELAQLRRDEGARWQDGAALVPLRGPGEGDVVGAVAVRPGGRGGLGGWLFGWAFPAALLSVAAAARWAFGRGPRRTYAAAALLLAVAAYADVRGAARGSTDRWLAATRLLLREAATRLPGSRARVALSDLAPVARGGGEGAELVEARSAPERPRRLRVAGATRAVVVARLGTGRWVQVRTSPAEARTGVWLVALLGVALVGPLTLAGLQWVEHGAARPRALREAVTAWAFLAPAALHLALFSVGPLLVSLYLAVHGWGEGGGGGGPGLATFWAVLRDPLVWGSLRNTVLYTLYVPVSMALALGVALVLNRSTRAVRLLRAAFLLPYLSSVVAVALVWQSMMSLGPYDWLGSPRTALLALMVLSIWAQVGYQMMVFLAGLQGIPPAYLEAARVDGANGWQRFWRVTFPLLRPVTLFVLATGVIGAFQVFTYVYVITGGGPLRGTDVVAHRLYQMAWESLQFGRGSALSLLLFLVLCGVTWGQFKLLSRRIEHA